MSYFKLFAFSLLVFSCIVGHGQSVKELKPVKSPSEVGFSEFRLARIDSFLNENINKGLMPNAVTFIARHGKVVHHKAFGFKNMETNELLKTDDIFRIASQTKAIVSVALMTLYEEGDFLLDDPISKYIPAFKNPQVITELNEKDTIYKARPAKREITIRHLLSHTSGISYGNVLTQKEHIPGVNSLEDISLKEAITRLGALPLSHDPGEAFTYGLNTDVIGYLIEVLSGLPLDEFISQRIFKPLDMNDSYFYLPDDKVKRLVTLYSKDSLNVPIYKGTNIANQTYPYSGAKKYFSGGAGIVGPIADYAKFCQMLLNGGKFNGKQIISKHVLALMTSNQIGQNEVWESQNKFGLGFEINTEKGAALLPGSVGLYGWGGMYSTDFKIDPKEDLIFLIYTNVFPFANNDINKRFRVLVYQALN
jgi:CubicO group peptidase (beta-lactamase class C family)